MYLVKPGADGLQQTNRAKGEIAGDTAYDQALEQSAELLEMVVSQAGSVS
jgi:hypothetical protein